MGRKLDLSGLTDDEAEHVLQVVQRDMRLRKKEEERLSELRQELDEESRRCRLLSRQRRFNQRCCIRCCGPFTFLFNPKRQCLGCRYNVCKTCRVFSRRDNAWLCSTCQKRRLLKTQSLEWFYTNVKLRFKRYGSAKILKTLYKKHLAEHGALSELTEGSIYEESVHNEGSFCGSDSAFYRQCEELSMADTLAVAMRVAAEAIDEAVSKAEFDTDNQNEAHYLREHRGVLIEELGKTIVQKIIRKRQSLAEIKPDYEHDWSVAHSADFHHQSTCRQVHPSPTHQPNLWRSRSAFSLLDNDPLELKIGVSHNQMPPQGWKKGGGGSAMSSWRSVDRLDSSSGSSVLKSSDGNWIALQSAQLSRPSLLTKRKSLVYSALERESGVVSAYEGMGSDNEAKPEPDSSWGAVLQELHRKMTDNNPQDIHSDQSTIPSPPMGHQSSADALYSDSEGNPKPHKLLALFKRKLPQEIRRPSSSRRTSIIDVNFNPEGPGEESSGVDEQEVCKVRRSRRKRRSKKEVEVADSSSVSDYDNRHLDAPVSKRNVKKDNQSHHASDATTPDTLTSGTATPDPFYLEEDVTGGGVNVMDQELTFKLHQLASQVSISHASTTEDATSVELDGGRDNEEEKKERREGGTERDQEENKTFWKTDLDVSGVGMELENMAEEQTKEKEEDSEEMKYKLCRLVAQSRITYYSSTEDERDSVGQSDEEDEEKNKEQRGEEFTFKLRQLEREVRANQFSSTEDELDRVGHVDGEGEGLQKENGKKVELVATLCRLADQVRVAQFSSTDDELDRASRGEGEEEEKGGGGREGEGEEAIDEETLWKMEVEKAVQGAQVRHLASLVSASQFSSTEDALDRVGGIKAEHTTEAELWFMNTDNEGAMKISMERRESIGELDAGIFTYAGDVGSEGQEVTDANRVPESDASDETRERRARATTSENVLDSETKVEGVQQEVEKSENEEVIDEKNREPTGAVEVLTEAVDERVKNTEERLEKETNIEAETEGMKEKTEERIATAAHAQHEGEEEGSDEKEGEERRAEGETGDVTDRRGKLERAESEEGEDVEFDSIISSMLMLSLEEMQGDTLADREKEILGEKGERNTELEERQTDENVEVRGEAGFKDEVSGERGRYVTEETVISEGFEHDNTTQESVGSEGERDSSEGPGENVIEKNEGKVSRRQESEVALIESGQQETDPQESPADLNLEKVRTVDMTTDEMLQVSDECKRIKAEEVEGREEQEEETSEEEEEVREETPAMEQIIERQGGTVGESEGRREKKETGETLKGNRGNVGQSDEDSEEEREEDVEEKNRERREGRPVEFTFKLLQLEREARSNQFSSTEDEVDQDGQSDGEEEGLQQEDAKKVELAATLCRLAGQVTLFSSTEDELDRAGRGEGGEEEEKEGGGREGEGEQAVDKKTPWRTEGETAVQGAQVRHLVSLVSASQFSSTEDELESDPVGHSDGESEGVEKEEGKKVELAATLCRLADQVRVTLFSSTEDELDRASRGEGEEEEEEKEGGGREGEGAEASDKETLWKMEVETAVQGAQVRHLASLVSASQFSSTEDELDPVGRGDGERERAQTGETSQGNEDGVGQSDENSEREREENEEGENEEQMEGEPGEFTFKLRQLEREARANQFSSTEDELDPIGHNDGEREGVQKEEGKKVVLAATLCRLANQVRVALFSSTDDDLDRVSRGEGAEEKEGGGREGEGEEEINDETLWKMQVETAVQGAQVRHLASLVSASQFSSTEDELDPVGHSDGERERAQTGETSQGNEDSVGQSDENSEREREENAEEKNREEREGRPGEFSFKLHQLVREARANLFSSTEDELEHVEHSDGGREGTQKEQLADVEDLEQSISSDQEGILSPEEIQNDRDVELDKAIQFISTLLELRYSAVSLRSITTEVLKVLNATEELLQGVEGRDSSSSQATAPSLPPNADPKKLDHRFSRLEENVYVAAGTVYNLEAEIGDLEECARGISGATSDKELCFLEEQVASAAARVQQSELQISDISARIAALKTAGLNVDPQSRFTKARTIPVMPITLDSSRQRRRRLPAPPMKDKET